MVWTATFRAGTVIVVIRTIKEIFLHDTELNTLCMAPHFKSWAAKIVCCKIKWKPYWDWIITFTFKQYLPEYFLSRRGQRLLQLILKWFPGTSGSSQLVCYSKQSQGFKMCIFLFNCLICKKNLTCWIRIKAVSRTLMSTFWVFFSVSLFHPS